MKKSVAIIGGGAAGMALACFLDPSKFEVSLFEKNKTIGRKFLVAGKGGFNLTHSVDQKVFKDKYSPSGFLDEALDTFPSTKFRNWLAEIGIPTYIGSSGRVFPTKGIKPIHVLEAIIAHLESRNVSILTQNEWKGDSEADIVVYAMGGASWPVTGSDGAWSTYFEDHLPFKASNCAFQVNWPANFIEMAEGKPLKNIALSLGDLKEKGEVVVTSYGLEGNAIYALSEWIQEELKSGPTEIYIDLKNHLTESEVLSRLQFSKEKTITNSLKRDVKLSKTSILLLQNFLSKEAYLDPEVLAAKIKNFPLQLLSAAPIAEAISTLGGIPVSSLDRYYQLHQKPNHYCIGEMIDWNAPTGGYLLQGCFSMAHHLAKKLNG